MTNPRTVNARGVAALIAVLLAAAVLLAMLGDWQLRRAEANRQLHGRYESAAALEPLTAPPAAPPSGGLGDLRYRRLRLDGRYVAGRDVLLDNMTHRGRAGYEVLTPFEPAGGGPWILVNRGWVPAGPDRRVLPDVALTSSPASVTGRIAPFPVPGIRLEAPAPEQSAPGPRVLSFPTAETLERALGAPIHGYQLWLDPDSPGGFVRDWRPETIPFERNLAYAGQWFLLAAGAAGLAAYFGFRLVRPGRGRR